MSAHTDDNIVNLAQYREKLRKDLGLSPDVPLDDFWCLSGFERYAYRVGARIVYDGLPPERKEAVDKGMAVKITPARKPLWREGRTQYLFKCSHCGHYATGFRDGFDRQLACLACRAVHSRKG